MYKYIFLLSLLFAFPIATAQEQPLAIINVCESGGYCHDAKEGDYVKLLACEKITLRSASYDPSGRNLSALWFVDGVNVAEGDVFNFSRIKTGYSVVTLVASNGDLSHRMSINIAAGENKPPKLEKVLVVTGSDDKELEYRPEQQQKTAKTALKFPLKIRREYDDADDQLTQEISGEIRNAVVTDKECDDDSCVTEMNFPETGTYPITFEDSDSCGQKQTSRVEVDVFENHPPMMILSGDFVCPEDKGCLLSGEESEDSDPEDLVVKYFLNVTQNGGTREYNSESPEIRIYGDFGTREVVLCGEDRFGGRSCAEPQKVILWRSHNRDPVANLSGTPKVVEVFRNFTLDASNSTDDHGIRDYEWHVFYYHNGWIEVLSVNRTRNSSAEIALTRTGTHKIELTVYDDGDLAPNNFSAKGTNSLEIEVVNSTVEALKQAEKERAAAAAKATEKTPAPGIPLVLAIFGLTWFLRRQNK